jgi:mannose-6-phosphate isomerase-like protein (cupin superfamily)
MKNETGLSPCEGTMVTMAGREVTYRIIGEQTGGDLALVEICLGPRLLSGPPHMHRSEDQVSSVLEGELMVQVGEQLFCAGPGDVVFKPRGVVHACWNPGIIPVRFLEFISPAGFEDYFCELAPLLPVQGSSDMPGAVELARRYGVEFDLDRLPEILQQYPVEAPWLQTDRTCWEFIAAARRPLANGRSPILSPSRS